MSNASAGMIEQALQIQEKCQRAELWMNAVLRLTEHVGVTRAGRMADDLCRDFAQRFQKYPAVEIPKARTRGVTDGNLEITHLDVHWKETAQLLKKENDALKKEVHHLRALIDGNREGQSLLEHADQSATDAQELSSGYRGSEAHLARELCMEADRAVLAFNAARDAMEKGDMATLQRAKTAAEEARTNVLDMAQTLQAVLDRECPHSDRHVNLSQLLDGANGRELCHFCTTHGA